MTNNQDELNRLISELSYQKQKDRKHLLKIEIAKATDRSVKRALQELLADIEKEERRNRIIGIFVVLVFILFGLFFLGVMSSKEKKNTEPLPADSLEQVDTDTNSSEQIVKEEVAKETMLSESEVKQWVSAVLDKGRPNLRYELEVSVDDKDQLVYITVAPPKDLQIDKLGRFRINAQGELEEYGLYVNGAAYNEWVVVSKKFMDVSEVSAPEANAGRVNQGSENLTAQEFASLYAQWSGSNFPLMHVDEYQARYGDRHEFDDSVWVIGYNDRDDHTVQLSEMTPYRMSKFFYTYDNQERKAYFNRNNGAGEVEYSPDLTNFINEHR